MVVMSSNLAELYHSKDPRHNKEIVAIHTAVQISRYT